MRHGEHSDDSAALVTDEERLPPMSAWPDVALGQNHEGDRLMVGHERKLVIAHAHVERLSPITRVDHLNVYHETNLVRSAP